MDLEWVDGPPDVEDRATAVATQLRGRAGRWAKIDHQEGFRLISWWAPLARNELYQVKTIPTTDAYFGPRDIYARFIGKGPST